MYVIINLYTQLCSGLKQKENHASAVVVEGYDNHNENT
jgi:hypothetical protein